jgi:putative transposase
MHGSAIAEDVVQTLERVCHRLGYPKTIRVDKGREFISRDLDLWAYANAVTLDFSRQGKPADNGFIEAFNSELQAECPNAHWFMSLADAGEKLGAWRRHHNEDRPHSAIGCNVPIAMHYPDDATSPSP